MSVIRQRQLVQWSTIKQGKYRGWCTIDKLSTPVNQALTENEVHAQDKIVAKQKQSVQFILHSSGIVT